MAKFEYDEELASELLERILTAFPRAYDKREGSVSWDIFAPIAEELGLLHTQAKWIEGNVYGDTANRESLIRLAMDRDVYILPATQAIVEGKFNTEIPLGAKFNGNKENYITYEFLREADGYYYYSLICENLGTVGNEYIGNITPIDTIRSLREAEITSILISGEDAEDTESFRERYYHSIRNRDYGFNISEYVYNVNQLKNVGGVRVYPAYPKNGDVTLVLVDSNYLPPTQETIDYVKEVLDPERETQKGIGIVPIGHHVIVKPAIADNVDIDLNITYSTEVTLDILKPLIEEKIEGYFDSLRKSWEDNYVPTNYKASETIVVRESYIETSILSINNDLPNSIIDIKVTAINGDSENYNVVKDGVPILGTITYTEI